MTEQQNDQGTPEGAVTENQTNADSGAADASESEPQNDYPARKEARYRHRAKEAEAERDQLREQQQQLQEQLVQLQTSELHRQAGEFLSDPEDISLTGKELSEFLTPEGWIDRASVEQAARSVTESRPGLSRSQPPVDMSQGQHGGGGKPAPSWATLLKG